MISPEMPTGIAIRQTIVDDEADGKLDDDVGIAGFRRCNGGHIDVKIGLAFTTVVNGVAQDDLDRATREGIAEVT